MEKRGKSWKYTLKHMKKTWTFHWCHNMSQLFQRQAKVGQTTAVSGTTEDRNWNEFWYLRSFKPVESSWIIDGNGFSADVQNQGKYCGKLFMPEHLGVQFFHHLKIWVFWKSLGLPTLDEVGHMLAIFPLVPTSFHHVPSSSIIFPCTSRGLPRSNPDAQETHLPPALLLRPECGEDQKTADAWRENRIGFFCIKSPKVFNDYVLTIYSLKSERESESVPTDYWSHYCIF